MRAHALAHPAHAHATRTCNHTHIHEHAYTHMYTITHMHTNTHTRMRTTHEYRHIPLQANTCMHTHAKAHAHAHACAHTVFSVVIDVVDELVHVLEHNERIGKREITAPLHQQLIGGERGGAQLQVRHELVRHLIDVVVFQIGIVHNRLIGFHKWGVYRKAVVAACTFY